jgi:hypothetical protein
MAETGERLIIVMVADIPEDGIDAFQRYEGLVLPMLDQHGGRLERRLRSADSRVEVHIVSFDSRTGFDSYMTDPDRLSHRELLAGIDLGQRVIDVHDVPAP